MYKWVFVVILVFLKVVMVSISVQSIVGSVLCPVCGGVGGYECLVLTKLWVLCVLFRMLFLVLQENIEGCGKTSHV